MKKPIPKKIRQLVWNKHIGEKFGSGTCLCCKITEITQMSFHCGHITSEKNGGDITIDNLLPICALCNSSMGSMNMWDFIQKHGLHKDDTLHLKEEVKRLSKLLEDAEERIRILQKNVMDQHEQNRRLVMNYEEI
jgi:hypothetical protein